MKSHKISVEDILLYCLFITIFKISIVPGEIRQAFKLLVLISVFFFLLSKLKRKRLLNVSCLYSGTIILSGLVNYFQHETTQVAVIEGIIYAIGIYDLYTLISYYQLKNKYDHCIKCLYKITLIYCLLSAVSVLIQGRGNGFTEVTYLFGNKFSTSYLFVLLIGLYSALHNKNIKKNKWRLYWIILVTAFISLYIGCITALLALLLSTFALLFSNKMQSVLTKPLVPVIGLCASAGIMFSFSALLQIPTIHRLVFDIFNKSASIYGRITIYEKYVFDAIQGNAIIGSGYNNGKIFSISNGVLGNAQNGLFEQFVAYGVIGVLVILLMTYYCYKESTKDSVTTAISIVVYTMIIAAVVEVTIGWFFFISIFLVRWNTTNHDIRSDLRNSNMSKFVNPTYNKS